MTKPRCTCHLFDIADQVVDELHEDDCDLQLATRDLAERKERFKTLCRSVTWEVEAGIWTEEKS